MPDIKTEFEEPVPEPEQASELGYSSSPPLFDGSLDRLELERPIASVPDAAAADTNLTEPNQAQTRSLPLHTYTSPTSYAGDSSRNLDSKKDDAVVRRMKVLRIINTGSSRTHAAAERPPELSSRSSMPPPLADRVQSRLVGNKIADRNRPRPKSRGSSASQALASPMTAVQSLITEAGGYHRLQRLMRNMKAIQWELNEGKSMENVSSFIAEVQRLRSTEQQYAALRSVVEGPDGLQLDSLRQKMQKQDPDKLKRLLHGLELTSDECYSEIGQQNKSPTRRVRIPDHIDPTRLANNDFGNMNPARARLISNQCHEDDPGRDLYEAERPVLHSKTKTGSNDIPLGAPQVKKASNLSSHSRKDVTQKRKESESPQGHDGKRVRYENEPVPEPIKFSLILSDDRLLALPRFSSTAEIARNFSDSEEGGNAPSTGMMLSVSRALHRSITEDAGTYPFVPYPTAFWASLETKVPVWGEKEFKKLKAGFQMPGGLYVHMLTELAHYVSLTNVLCWENMASDGDQCIISYVIDGPKRLDGERAFEACDGCSSQRSGFARPCALLKTVCGTPTLIFLPRPSAHRAEQRLQWNDIEFWMAI